MASSPKRSAKPYMPDWGYTLIIGVLAALLVGLLVLSGVLAEWLRVITPLGENLMQAAQGIAILAGLYFAPCFVAWGTTRFLAIAAANLLLGWTVIGWALILIWAIAEQCSKKKPTPPPLP